MKHAQHAAYNPKLEIDRIIQTSPLVVFDTIKVPPMRLKVTTTLEKGPNHPILFGKFYIFLHKNTTIKHKCWEMCET